MAARRKLMAPVVLGVLGTALLLGLSAWQVQRLGWKEGLIARLDARLSAEPVALPEAPDPEADAFLNVALEGRIAGAPGYVLTTKRPYGPGYRVVAPVETGGRRVLVDLGYIPEAARGEVLPPEGTEIAAEGALFWPEGDAFTPDPETGQRLFFSRQVGPLAETLGTEPVLVVAAEHSLGKRPLAERLGVDLPNNHRNYAITWASLAAVWLAMSVLWYRRERRAAPG